jgi:hypothetical protein
MTGHAARIGVGPTPPAHSAPGLDVTAYLTIWLVLLFGISAQQVLPGVGALGSPAMLIALTAPLLWVAGAVLPHSGLSRDPHPLRLALFVYLAYMIASFAVATSRSLTELESSGAVRALITETAMVGVALLVADGVRDRARLDTLLRRLVIATAFLGCLGIAQFLTGNPLQVRVPGLTWNFIVEGIEERSIFNRPLGTTMHPIELSVVTASMLPLAIHFALNAESLTTRRNMATAAALIAVAMPLAISRSGIVSAVVGLFVLFVGWGWRRRLTGALTVVAFVPVMWAVVPGLVGTFASLFGDAEGDPSVQARIERGPRVMALVRLRPWLGLGNGTWSLEDYFLLDNEVYVTMLETGILGLLLVFALISVGVVAGLLVARLPTSGPGDPSLGNALAASIAALGVSLLTFDAFHYRILTGSLFLLLGSVGALWRLHGTGPALVAALKRTAPAGQPPSG